MIDVGAESVDSDGEVEHRSQHHITIQAHPQNNNYSNLNSSSKKILIIRISIDNLKSIDQPK